MLWTSKFARKIRNLQTYGNAWPSMKTLIRTSDNSSTPQARSVWRMRLSEEQEASASQVVRNWEDKKGHDGHKLSCSSVPDEIIDEVLNYCTRWGDLYQMQNVCLKFLYRQPQTLWNSYLHNCSNPLITWKILLGTISSYIIAISSMSRRIYLWIIFY